MFNLTKVLQYVNILNTKFKGGFAMHIAEARSFNDGIEFYHKNITIMATRNSKGELSITTSKSSKEITVDKKKTALVALAIAVPFSFLYNNTIVNYHWIIVLLMIWGAICLYYFVLSQSKKSYPTYKYHAAEHKVLNYWDKYEKVPETVQEVIKMNSISWRCGSTGIAIVMILVTLCVIGSYIIPFLFLKILWYILSVVITVYLWGKGKCNFLQKMVIIEPTIEEVEVAFEGFKEYMRIKSEK